MSFFGGMSGTLDFLALFQARIGTLLDQHGITRTTDAASASSMGPFSLLSELEAPSEEYDDRPAIEKVLASVSAAAKKMKLPQMHSFRIVGAHPTLCTALILIGGTCAMVASADAADLDKLGRWSLSVRTAFHRNTYEGTVLDHESLEKAFSALTGYLTQIQEAFQLVAAPPRSAGFGEFMGVPMPLGAVPGPAEG